MQRLAQCSTQKLQNDPLNYCEFHSNQIHRFLKKSFLKASNDGLHRIILSYNQKQSEYFFARRQNWTETKPTDKPEKSTAEKKQPIILKDLGEGIEEANILKVAVKKGDEIKEGTILIELETDKSTIEIPSDFAGKVESIAIKEGDKIKIGQEILTISIVSSETTPAKEEFHSRRNPQKTNR